MKRPRKVSLISVYDYPKNDYSAHWLIDKPQGADLLGWRWAAHILSYEPVAWSFKGKVSTERPDFPQPVYPSSAHLMREAAYRRATPERQAEERQIQHDFRVECAKVHQAHPIPLYVLEEVVDVAPTKDEADTAAQTWVRERMNAYRRPKPLIAMTEDDVKNLVAEFDTARAAKEFGRVDTIRGTLRSQGIILKEPEQASSSDATTWKRSKQAGHALTLGPLDMLAGVGRAIADKLLGWMFTLAYATSLRNARMQSVADAINAGAGAGLKRIYNGSRPATCGTATTLLATLTYTDPCEASVSGGVLTFDTITGDSSADTDGTATWFRDVDSTGTCAVDGSVGTSGSDLNMNSVGFTTGQQVDVTSQTYTEGNA